MKTRKEEPVKNHPGIYKLSTFDSESGTWKFKGYRATRWLKVDGVPKKEQEVFDYIEDATQFRTGIKGGRPSGQPSAEMALWQTSQKPKERFTFGALIEEWKPFHFLKLARGTKAVYEKLIPHLDFLRSYNVEDIGVSVIDELVKYWVHEYPKTPRRQHFEKELDLLKAILNYYRKRKNHAYVIPILDEHREAADVAKKVRKKVKSLSQEDLGRFLEALRSGSTPQYFPLALAQFCLGLRIGEACGLNWDGLDLENRIARITLCIDWDQATWEPYVKERPKNKNERVLVIPTVLVAELKKLKENHDPSVPFVFHRNGRPLNRKTIATAYNKTLQRLGITHVSGTHMMRKTAATQANRVTGDFYAVSRLMDHSSPNITLRYVEEISDQKRKVADALDGVIKGMGGEKPENRPTAPIPQNPTKWDHRNLRLIKSVS